MKEEDRQRLKNAFKTAIEKSPLADAPIDGMADGKGGEMTLRKLFTATMESESFYTDVERDIAKGLTSIERIEQQIAATHKISIRP